MRKVLTLGLLVALLAGCASGARLGDKKDLGTFRLGHNVVVAVNATKGPFSRDATEEQLKTAMESEIQRRLGETRYEGSKWFHLGVSIDGYVLAAPGIPVVVSPKSVMIISVRVWDDALGKRLTDEPHQITVFESASGGTLIGSGYTRTAEQQLKDLTQNAALAIENYLASNPQWFEGDADAPLPEAATAAPEPRPEMAPSAG